MVAELLEYVQSYRKTNIRQLPSFMFQIYSQSRGSWQLMKLTKQPSIQSKVGTVVYSYQDEFNISFVYLLEIISLLVCKIF